MNFLFKFQAGCIFPYPCNVSDGQLANAATFNGGLASKQVDNTFAGKQELADTDPVSGESIENVQRELNAASSFTGMPQNSDEDVLPVWTNNDVGSPTNDLKDRAEALTEKFNDTTGHSHDGSPGGGAPVSAANLSNFNNFIGVMQTFSKTGASGTSTDVSSSFTTKTPGGTDSQVGIYTTAPDNICDIYTLSNDEEIEDAGGQKVYGRLTESAGVWTLSFFTNEAGVETAHSLSAQDIRVYFGEVFTMETRPTRGADLGRVGSLDKTADVVDASPTQRGLVNTGTQSFAGNKTFTGTVTASNLTGTNSGDVSLNPIGAVPNANGASLSGQSLTLQPADGTFGGVLTAIAQTIAGLKTFAAGIIAQSIARFEGWFETDIEDDATATGSNATLSEPAKHIRRLTLGTLASITGVTAPSNTKARHHILVNRTGVAISIVNDAGTAANRILTGTGANMSMAANAAIWLAYDFTTAKWQVIGGSGGSTSPLTTKGDLYTYSTADTRLPVGANGFSLVADSAQTTGLKYEDRRIVVFSTENISAAGTITAAANLRELRRVQGNGAAVTANTTTPITAGTTEGQELFLKGMHDDNTVTIENSGNVDLNGNMTLYAGSTLHLMWVDSKWLEIARSV